MDTSNKTIETENLCLKSISLEYKEDIFKEFTPEITTYMTPKSPEKIEETVEFIKKAMKKNKAGHDFYVVILKKGSNAFLGGMVVHNIDEKILTFGVWIKKSAHGNGYGKEAIVALKKWVDKNLDYEYILYPVDVENIASRKIPEFLGGKIIREYNEINKSGKELHLIEYRIYP